MNAETTFTVSQLAKLAGITRRTLHHYDQIGLLQPENIGLNGYRYYGKQAVLRLQQILFYRELGLGLDEIRIALNQPDFNLLNALQQHKQSLLQRAERLLKLVETVENTILHIKGEISMQEKDFYSGFDEEQQKRYEEEARQRWGSENVDESSRRWNQFTREQKNAALAENHAITQGIADHLEKGYQSPEVQYWVDRWFKAINTNFYPCSLEVFEGLGHMYVDDARFTATYEKIRPGMAAFMEKAMTHYCQVAARKG